MISSRLLTSFCLASALFVGCDSKVTQTTSTDANLEAVAKCLTPQLQRLRELIDFSDLWRLNDNSNNPPDPSGLTWSISGNSITYSINVGTSKPFTISGRIDFFLIAGGPFVPTDQTGPGGRSLSQAIDDTATEMRNQNPNVAPVGFMVGEWSLSDTGGMLSSSGETSNPPAFTGMIGGSTNANELEEVRTTQGVAAVAGGPPPIQRDIIDSLDSEQMCRFRFRITSLMTDQMPGSEFPEGTLEWDLTNNSTGVTIQGTLVFNKTATAVLQVNDGSNVPIGTFNVNLNDYSVSAA